MAELINATVRSSESLAKRLLLAHAGSAGYGVTSITANATISQRTGPIQILTPDADRNVTFEADVEVDGSIFMVFNDASVANGYKLTVKSSAPATITILPPKTGAILIHNGTSWTAISVASVSSGMTRLSEAIAAGTALTASASETVLGTYTIPANTLKQRTRLHVRAMVAVTANNSTTTLTARMRLGGLSGTALITTAAVDTSAGHVVVMDFDLISRADPSDASSLCGSGWYCDPGAVGGAVKAAALAATSFDTNSDLDLVITGQWSAADANSCALQILSVDVVG